MLEAAGYTFMSATSVAEGLSLAIRSTPRLILPVALLTARKAAEDVKIGLAAGGNDFIVKPFDHEKLLARVDYWTKRSAAPA